MKQDSTSSVERSGSLSRLVSYVLIFLMMTCVIMTIGNLIQNALPDWHSGIIVGVSLFIVIDRLYTYQRFKSLKVLDREWAITLGSQWIVITAFIKVLLSYSNGFDSFIGDFSQYIRGDFEGFFNPEFVVTMLLALLAWNLTGEFSRLLDEVGLDHAIALRESATPVPSDMTAHQRLANLIIGMGIVLVLLTALARVDFRPLFSNTTGTSNAGLSRLSGGEVGALLYFLFGLALLSQSRLMSLQIRWDMQHVPISSNNLARRWGAYSLVFILFLVTAISFLPSNDNLGFFSLIGTFLVFLFNVLFFTARLILNIVYLLVSLPFLLFGKTPPLVNQLEEASSLPAIPEAAAPIASDPTWVLIRSIVLWGVLTVIIVFSIIRFVRQHGGIKTALRKLPFTNWIVRAWQFLRGNWNKTTTAISRAVADGWQNILSRLERNRVIPTSSLIRLRSLDPRRQVYFFYLAMIRRSGEQGLRREPSQTPAEYAARLERALPSVDEDVHAITESFVKARYSRAKVDTEDANLVKVAWGHIRQALQMLNNPASKKTKRN